ncbi:MAG: hypothetical protein NUV61_03030, partial [Candidatus Azambacteria bacterium]|nr:hypothetical protein [Candidatus Azambacteria bacterium]
MSHLCNDRDGVCEEDHCRCDDKEFKTIRTIQKEFDGRFHFSDRNNIVNIEGSRLAQQLKLFIVLSVRDILEQVVPPPIIEKSDWMICRQEVKERIQKIL